MKKKNLFAAAALVFGMLFAATSCNQPEDNTLPLIDKITIGMDDYVLPYNSYGPNYQLVIPLCDLVDEPVIIYDKVSFSVSGFMVDSIPAYHFSLVSVSQKDGYWKDVGSEVIDIPMDSPYFTKDFSIRVVDVFDNSDVTNLCLVWQADLSKDENSIKHRSEVRVKLSETAKKKAANEKNIPFYFDSDFNKYGRAEEISVYGIDSVAKGKVYSFAVDGFVLDEIGGVQFAIVSNAAEDGGYKVLGMSDVLTKSVSAFGDVAYTDSVLITKDTFYTDINDIYVCWLFNLAADESVGNHKEVVNARLFTEGHSNRFTLKYNSERNIYETAIQLCDFVDDPEMTDQLHINLNNIYSWDNAGTIKMQVISGAPDDNRMNVGSSNLNLGTAYVAYNYGNINYEPTLYDFDSSQKSLLLYWSIGLSDTESASNHRDFVQASVEISCTKTSLPIICLAPNSRYAYAVKEIPLSEFGITDVDIGDTLKFSFDMVSMNTLGNYKIFLASTEQATGYIDIGDVVKGNSYIERGGTITGDYTVTINKAFDNSDIENVALVIVSSSINPVEFRGTYGLTSLTSLEKETLTYNSTRNRYEKIIPLYDLTHLDMYKDDPVFVKLNLVSYDSVGSYNVSIVSTAAADGDWKVLGDKVVTVSDVGRGDRVVVDDKIVIEEDFDSTDNSTLVLVLYADLLPTEDSMNHRSEVTYSGEINSLGFEVPEGGVVVGRITDTTAANTDGMRYTYADKETPYYVYLVAGNTYCIEWVDGYNYNNRWNGTFVKNPEWGTLMDSKVYVRELDGTSKYYTDDNISGTFNITTTGWYYVDVVKYGSDCSAAFHLYIQ